MSMTHVPTNLCFVFQIPRQSSPLCLWRQERKSWSSSSLGHHGCFIDLEDDGSFRYEMRLFWSYSTTMKNKKTNVLEQNLRVEFHAVFQQAAECGIICACYC